MFTGVLVTKFTNVLSNMFDRDSPNVFVNNQSSALTSELEKW